MVNKVILIGNVGMDPEVRTMEGGVKVARVRLATTERFRDRQSGENKEHTEWHTITLWRGLADVVDNYVRKGSQIYVEGRLRTREWTDQTGAKRYATEILADAMNLLGRRADNGRVSDNTGTYTAQPQPTAQQTYQQPAPQPSYQQPAPQQVVAPAEDSDDLPF
ncbi:MAG: single-stranded DNA-binding protein [Alistipes sp.]|nr:single-stranded DNA-binding protein [Alistipes sp.]